MRFFILLFVKYIQHTALFMGIIVQIAFIAMYKCTLTGDTLHVKSWVVVVYDKQLHIEVDFILYKFSGRSVMQFCLVYKGNA